MAHSVLHNPLNTVPDSPGDGMDEGGIRPSEYNNPHTVVLDESLITHNNLGGLTTGDPHTQYHNDSRALTWLGTRSTSDLAEGSNLYYTNARADARVAIGIAAHESDPDPHPQYTDDTEAGVIAAGAVTTHVGLSDPHTQYRLESDDHSHQTTGAQGGQLDHGAALTGLGDDDHPQYVLRSILTTDGDIFVRASSAVTRLGVGSEGEILTVVSGAPAWTANAAAYTDEEAQDAVGGILLDGTTIDFTYDDGAPHITAEVIQSALDHGSIGGLGDDDHTQYALLAGRSGGQTLIGGTGSGDDLNLISTSDATPGTVRIIHQVGMSIQIIAAFDPTIITLGTNAEVGVGGYLSVDTPSPANTTAGDLTAIRGHFGSDATFTSGLGGVPVGAEIRASQLVISGTIGGSGAFRSAMWLAAVFNDDGDGPQGFSVNPVFTPSANINNAYGQVNFVSFGPPTSVTITNAYASYGQSVYSDVAGAVSQGYTYYIASPLIGGALKPSVQRGLYVADQGASGIGAAIGLGIATPTGATTNYALEVSGSAAAHSISVLHNSVAGYLHTQEVGARVYHNTSQTVGNFGTVGVVALVFNSERWDTDSFHDTSSNTSRLTAPVSGYYLIGGHIQWDSNGTGARLLGVRVNGSTTIAFGTLHSRSDMTQSISTYYFLNASDFVELICIQDSGANRSVISSGNQSAEFWISLQHR